MTFIQKIKRRLGRRKEKETKPLPRHIYLMEASGPEMELYKVPQDRRSPRCRDVLWGKSKPTTGAPLRVRGVGLRTGQEKGSTPELNCPAYSREALSPGLEMCHPRRTVL